MQRRIKKTLLAPEIQCGTDDGVSGCDDARNAGELLVCLTCLV